MSILTEITHKFLGCEYYKTVIASYVVFSHGQEDNFIVYGCNYCKRTWRVKDTFFSHSQEENFIVYRCNYCKRTWRVKV